MRIDIYHHYDELSWITLQLEEILNLLELIQRKEEHMAGELDLLKTAVANNTTVIGSAIVLIQGLKEKLDAAIASGDPAALTALSDELGAQDKALADAVVANTPNP
jgi:uncharacterized MnhB-related membrane protein